MANPETISAVVDHRPKLALVPPTPAETSGQERPILLRIITPSATPEEFVARYGRFAEQDSLLLVLKRPQPVGASRHIQIVLNDGVTPLVTGVALSLNTAATGEATRLRFVELDDPSREMFRQLCEADFADPPTHQWAPPLPKRAQTLPLSGAPVAPPIPRIDTACAAAPQQTRSAEPPAVAAVAGGQIVEPMEEDSVVQTRPVDVLTDEGPTIESMVDDSDLEITEVVSAPPEPSVSLRGADVANLPAMLIHHDMMTPPPSMPRSRRLLARGTEPLERMEECRIETHIVEPMPAPKPAPPRMPVSQLPLPPPGAFDVLLQTRPVAVCRRRREWPRMVWVFVGSCVFSLAVAFGIWGANDPPPAAASATVAQPKADVPFPMPVVGTSADANPVVVATPIERPRPSAEARPKPTNEASDAPASIGKPVQAVDTPVGTADAHCYASIGSTPTGVRVTWNGTKLGTTPLEDVAVPCGEANVGFTRPRYTSAHAQVTAEPGSPVEVSRSLTRHRRLLRISVVPRDATVWVNGRRLSRKRSSVAVRTFSRVKVTAKRRGYRARTVRVRMRNSNRGLRVRLSPRRRGQAWLLGVAKSRR